MKSLLTKSVPFSNIRHNDLPCYTKEGFGGKPIEQWPPYTFFCEYLAGHKEGAYTDFALWYRRQLDKYGHVLKSEGGMHKGSLYQLIENEAQKPFNEVDEETKDKAILKRVGQRFALLEKIRSEGFGKGGEIIKGVKKGSNVYLLGGHHRAAILRALGHEILPNVLVFPNKTLYSLYTKLR